MKNDLRKVLVVAAFMIVASSSVFAKVNLSSSVSIAVPYSSAISSFGILPELAFGGDYEFNINKKDSLAIGADCELCFLTPYAGLNFSYIHCLQSESEHIYKWYFKTELRAGSQFSMVSEDDGATFHCGFLPCATIQTFFSFRPTTRGFYLEARPFCTVGIETYTNPAQVFFTPGVTFGTGFRF